MKRPDDPSRSGADPLRLFEDPAAPPALADALRAVHGRGPDRDQLAKMATALGLAIPLVLPAAAAAPAAAAPAATTAAVGSGAAAAGAGAGAAGVKLVIAGLAAAGAVAVATVGIGGHGGAPAPRPAPAPVVQKAKPRAPEPAEESFFAKDPTLPAPPEPAEPAAPAHRRHVARPPAAPAERQPPEAALDAASRLREEAALVQRAERLLTSDPAGALRLTEERKRRFPGGALDQEAEVVAIDALLRLGRRPEATTRAHAFEAAHAGSLHARRIKRLLGD
jgi:hypothetical protein